MGGSDLNDDYTLKTKLPYKFTTQLRNSKQSSSSEHMLMKRRSDATAITFKGNLEVSGTCITEYDKESYLTALKEQVGFYGLHSLFSMPDSSGKMHSLVDDAHLFSLSQVRDEYDTRMIQPSAVFEVDASGKDTTTETAESIFNGNKAFDEYEQYDTALSRLIVESLLSPSYRETIKTRFSHHDSFEELPGQVYFMMVLDACNTSAAIDIDSAQVKFDELLLSNFPGQDVSALSTLALKYIKIMMGAYNLPTKLATKLLLKVQKTETEIFNRNILEHYRVADELEREFALKDPKLMILDSRYPKYGPVGCCSFLQEQYSILFTAKRWEATTSILPSGNLTPITGDSTRSCYYCGEEGHLRNACPGLGRGPRTSRRGNQGRGNG